MSNWSREIVERLIKFLLYYRNSDEFPLNRFDWAIAIHALTLLLPLWIGTKTIALHFWNVLVVILSLTENRLLFFGFLFMHAILWIVECSRDISDLWPREEPICWRQHEKVLCQTRKNWINYGRNRRISCALLNKINLKYANISHGVNKVYGKKFNFNKNIHSKRTWYTRMTRSK